MIERRMPIPLPSRLKRAPAPEPRRTRVPLWMLATAGAAVFLVALLVARWLRTPPDPELLRPARAAAPAPAPSADGSTQEYRSPNVIIRFNSPKAPQR